MNIINAVLKVHAAAEVDLEGVAVGGIATVGETVNQTFEGLAYAWSTRISMPAESEVTLNLITGAVSGVTGAVVVERAGVDLQGNPLPASMAPKLVLLRNVTPGIGSVEITGDFETFMSAGGVWFQANDSGLPLSTGAFSLSTFHPAEFELVVFGIEAD
jgi:hypothetical protein